MEVAEVIAIIDEYLVSSGKRFIGLRAASSLLESKSTEPVDLKDLLERNQIRHAYQTEAKPRQWRIPHSNEEIYKENRAEFLRGKWTEQKAELERTPTKIPFKYILIFVVLGYLAYHFLVNGSSSVNETVIVVNTQSFATYSKADFDEMYQYVADQDEDALRKMLNSGRIILLEKGTRVNLVDVHLGYSIIRQRGSTEKLWIASERVSTGR